MMNKTSVYFEKFSLWNIMSSILSNNYSGKLLGNNRINIYYIESTTFEKNYIIPFLNKCNIQIERLEFKMMDIKDKRGELIRIRIPRKELFEFQSQILNSAPYKALYHESWTQDRLLNYISKGLIDAGIMEELSVSRMLYCIQVVYWHMQNNKYGQSIFVINKRPWSNIYKNYAEKYNIKLVFVKNRRLTFNRAGVNRFLRNYPKLYSLVKNFFYKFSFDVNKKQSKYNLYIDGRGDINLINNGDHSDFFWYLNSNFPATNILYKCFSGVEKDYLLEHGISSVSEGVILSNKYKRSYSKPKINNSPQFKDESKVMKSLVASYDLDRYIWSSFFKYYDVKIYFTWYKYTKDHIAIADAVNDNGGISVLWQMALDGYESISCNVDCDISFCFSNLSHELDKRLNSNIKYTVLTGYLKDYAPALLKERALEIRKKLQANGAEKIVFVIDENSIDDSRWHTGHELQQENYSHILIKVLETPWLGVIFKPKTVKTLFNRLGPVKTLLEEVLKTGRCYIYDVSGRHTTSASPVLAGLSSDLCIHGHLSSGTAALECALEGLPTLLIDREGSPDSKLHELPEGKVVFYDWPTAIEAVMEHFNSPEGIPGFGDWSSIIEDLDPFRDGKAAYRMGTYLHWLIQGYEDGLDKESIMENAAEKYRKQWGQDKVIDNNKLIYREI